MDNLLCNESWLSHPLTPEPFSNFRRSTHDGDMAAMFTVMDVATVDEAITMDLEKELCFSNHGDKFIEFLVSKKLTNDRLQTIQWLIQARNRLNLSLETVFSAANCFDRFVYMTSCNEWTKWMVELVALTSLSIASKFNEVTSPSLQELQMEGLNHMFHYKTVLEMELILLRSLEWRVNSVTSYSFSQLLVSRMGLVGEHMMISRITEHLLDDLYDLKMLQYPPTVAAIAALWNVIEEKTVLHENFVRMMNLFGQEHKEKFVKCVDEKKSRNVEHEWSWRRKAYEEKSILSVLQRGEVMNMNGIYGVGDLCAIFQILRSKGSDKKRDRDTYQDQIRPPKRKTILLLN